MKNCNHVSKYNRTYSEEVEQEMTVPLRRASFNMLKTQ